MSWKNGKPEGSNKPRDSAPVSRRTCGHGMNTLVPTHGAGCASFIISTPKDAGVSIQLSYNRDYKHEEGALDTRE